MHHRFSRREFLVAGGMAAAVYISRDALATPPANVVLPEVLSQASDKGVYRIVDMHVHFDEKNPNFVGDLVKVCERLNMTACVLTPYSNRKVIADAAKQYPARIVPFGFVDLDAPDVVKQVEELHALNYRGLGELEVVKKPFTDASYMPVYELANRYGWVVLFHTGIGLRKKFDEPKEPGP